MRISVLRSCRKVTVCASVAMFFAVSMHVPDAHADSIILQPTTRTVSTNTSNTCVVLATGTVQCWGQQLGVPISVPSDLGPAISVSSNQSNTCVVLRTFSVRCWGEQLNEHDWSPIQVPADIGPAISVETNEWNTCVLLRSAVLRCWGVQLTATAYAPGYLSDVSDVKDFSNSPTNVCVVFLSGGVSCWGTFWDRIQNFSAVQVPSDLEAAVSISANYSNACAVGTSGVLRCWGLQVDTGNPSGMRTILVPGGINSVTRVATNPFNTCAILVSDSVTCWGTLYGSSGQISVPSGLSGVQVLSSDPANICSILLSRVVRCWGRQLNSSWALPSIEVPSDLSPVGLGVPLSSAFTPSAPNITGAVPSNAQARISFAVPSDSGASEVIGYEYSIDGGLTWTTAIPTQTNEPLVITGLANGTSYSVKLRALNAFGSGEASDAISVTPMTLPSAPNVNSVVAGNHQATVNFTGPSDIGGADITNFEYSVNGGSSWTAMSPAQTSGPLVITGLSNGLGYGVKIRAVNAAGPGAASDALLVTPKTTANAPVITSAVAGNASALVTFSEASDDGGAAVVSYEYSLDNGENWVNGSASPLRIGGLANGATYSVKVRAVNSVGAGVASNPVSVKPIAPASAPTVSGVTAGNAQATLTIAAPSQINDSSLSGYDYSINNGSTWSHFASVDSPFTITGLTNGTTYQVKVRAVNSAGPGAASDAVTVNATKLVPAVPSIASITRGNGQATVNVKAPTDVTAQSITGYQFNVNNGALWNPVTLTNGSFTVTGLANGTSYAFKIRSVNANGVSGMSAKALVTPMTTASATTIQSIKPLNGGLAVTFGGAINNGGSVAKNYQYSLDGGSTWKDCVPALKLGPLMTIKGLTNGTGYQVAIRMVNAVGPGDTSNVVEATPMTTPSAPAIANAAVGKTTATLTLGSSANGGSAIKGYAYSLDNKTWTSVTPSGGQFTVSGLTAFKTYKIYVRASNVMGNGAVASTTVKTLK
jgi:Fibronectin type III domain